MTNYIAPILSESFQQEIRELIKTAESNLDAGLYDLSQKGLNEILKRCYDYHPQHESIYSFEAILLLCKLDYALNRKEMILPRLDKMNNAHLVTIAKASDASIGNTLVLLGNTMYGMILHEQGYLEQARAKLESVIDNHKKLPHRLNEEEVFTLFKAYSEVQNALKDFDGAVESAQIVLKFLLEQEKKSTASSLQSTTRAANILGLRYYLAEIHTVMGNYTLAENEGKLASQHSHIKHVDATLAIKIYHHLGYTGLVLGHPEIALQAYESLFHYPQSQTVLSDKQYAYFLIDLAGLYAHQNNVEQVHNIFRKILQLEVEWAIKSLSIAEEYLKNEQYFQAGNQYELALMMYSTKPQLFKNSPSAPIADIQQNLGFLSNRLGKYEEATKYLHLALGSFRLNTDNDLASAIKTINALTELAFAYQKIGKNIEAETKLKSAFDIIEKAYSKYPKEQNSALDLPCIDVMTDLGQLYIDQQRSDEALALFAKKNKEPMSIMTIRQVNQIWKIQTLVGDSYAAKEQHNEAKKTYNNILKTFRAFYKFSPSSIESNEGAMQAIPEILKKLAKICEKEGNFRDSVECLKHNNAVDYLKYDPSKPEVSFSYKDNIKIMHFTTAATQYEILLPPSENITQANILANILANGM